MSDYAKRDTTVERRTELFHEAAEIIGEDFAGDLTVADVAHRVAASRRGLQRAFRQAGATSFRTYLATVRMQRAAEMLLSGDGSVQQVAGAVGYRQPAQFAKAFRRHYGCTPTLFRSEQGDVLPARQGGAPAGFNGNGNGAVFAVQAPARSVT